MRFTCALLAAAWLLCPCELRGQTIAPLVAEYSGTARGKFQLINSSLYPIHVVLEPVSFTVDSLGRARYFPLDPSLRLKLSSKSFAIEPKETFAVFYEARAQQLPAWFTIYATITGAKKEPGLQVALRLPHTVYLTGKARFRRESVTLMGVGLSDSARTIVGVVENHGTAYGRVKSIDVQSHTARKTFPGFPVFPGGKRLLRLDWDQAGEPERLVLRFEKFDLEHRFSP